MSKFDKKMYDILNEKNVGLLIRVDSNKRAISKWAKLTNSEEFNSNSNYAIIPKKIKNSNGFLIIIDIDTKNNSKGLDSFNKLQRDINLPISKTVKTPSGGYHCYLYSTVEPKFKRYNKEYKDIEFIHTNSSANGYVLLPTNKGINTKDSKGNKIKGSYDLLIDDFNTIFSDENIDKGDKIVSKLNDLLLSNDNTLPSKNNANISNIETNSNNLTDKQLNAKIDVTKEQLDILLQYAPNEDYNDWITFGGHLKKAGGTLEQFLKWSLSANNAGTKKAIIKKWKELPTSIGTGIGALYYNAIETKKANIISYINNADKDTLLHIDTYKSLFEYPYIGKNEFELTILPLIEDRYYQLFNRNMNNKTLNAFINSLFDDEYYDKIAENNNKDDNSDDTTNKDDYIPNTLWKYSDLYSSKMKVGKDYEENELSYKEQDTIIRDIIEHIKIIKTDKGNKIAIFDKNYTNYYEIGIGNLRLFSLVIKKEFPKSCSKDKRKEYINFAKILDFLNSVNSNNFYKVNKVKSIKFRKDYTIDEDSNTIIYRDKKTFKPHNLDNISDEVKKEVIKSYHNQWDDKIDKITKYSILSKYIEDTKGMDIVILAPSNFGKGYHFNMLNSFGIAKKVEINDYVKNGSAINNCSLSDLKESYFNILDEQNTYIRKLFDINGTLYYRGLYQSAIEVKVGNKVLLSADDKGFSNIDQQVINRIHLFDYRSKKILIDELVEDVSNKLNINPTIYRHIVENYYYELILNTIDKYDSFDYYQIMKEKEELEKQLKDSNYKVNKEDIDSFENNLNEAIETIVSDVEVIENAIKQNADLENRIHISKDKNKLIFSNARKTLTELLTYVNSDLAYELKYKNILSIAKNGHEYLEYKSIRNNKGKLIKGIVIDLEKMENDHFIEIDDNIRRLKIDW